MILTFAQDADDHSKGERTPEEKGRSTRMKLQNSDPAICYVWSFSILRKRRASNLVSGFTSYGLQRDNFARALVGAYLQKGA